MRDYSAKTIYLGIDVHKKTYSVTAICDKQIVKKDKLPADPVQLGKYCENKFKGAKIFSAYEAGFCGFSLHRILTSLGIENRIVHPAGIEIASRERVKNDRRDSEKISVQLAEGRLRGIYVPTTEREGCREITRIREATVRKRTRVNAQIKCFLHRQGLFRTTDETVICKTKVERLLENIPDDDASFALKILCEEWLYLNLQIKKIDEKLALQAKEDRLEKTYRSLPGVGPQIARILANELGICPSFLMRRSCLVI